MSQSARAVAFLCLPVVLAAAPPLLPWQRWAERPDEAAVKRLESLFGLSWQNSGGPEGKLSTAGDPGPWGGKQFRFDVRIDHHNAGQYPQGWPSFEVRPAPPLDFGGYDALRYWVRCDTALDRELSFRFILWSGGQGRLQVEIPRFRPGQWLPVVHRLRDVPAIDQVDRLHFFLCESDYQHGDELTFRVGGFQLCNLQREVERLPPGQAALGLWVGERGDTSERIVIQERGTPSLPGLMVCETGAGVSLEAADELWIRFHEVFTATEVVRRMGLGQEVLAGQVVRIQVQVDTSGLEPGYYLVVADVRRNGASLLGGRVGSDDLYVHRPGESMTFTVLSVRTGMVMWIRDQLYGDIIGWGRAALPHVYDPLDPGTYREFMRLMASATWKHTEGNEAGDTGLALAAEAFRKSGDEARTRFAEWLLDDSVDHMVRCMQAPGGGVRTTTDELGAGVIAPDWAKGGYTYDSNQIGEWMRAITYAILYYSQVPEKRPRAQELSAAVRRSADFLVRHAVQESDGLPRVLRHLTLVERPDGSVEPVVYRQEGRQCDVYLGRALAGLSYYAYALQRLGEKVPEDWWEVMDNTAAWTGRKIKPNGWFDWQCEDVVEGGCHTFLGNIYIAEGLFGIYLAAAKAGRAETARTAQALALRTHRYVTDDCWIRGQRFSYPTEFWVGPYVYWLYTQWLDTVGPDPQLRDWLQALDRIWSQEREWKDFLDRPTDGTGYVSRAADNGMLNVAILGYLGIRQMAEIGKPLHWDTAP